MYEAAAEVIGAALFEREKVPDRDLTIFENPLQQRLVRFYRDSTGSKSVFYQVAAKICGRFPKFAEKWASKAAGDLVALPGNFKILVGQLSVWCDSCPYGMAAVRMVQQLFGFF